VMIPATSAIWSAVEPASHALRCTARLPPSRFVTSSNTLSVSGRGREAAR